MQDDVRSTFRGSTECSLLLRPQSACSAKVEREASLQENADKIAIELSRETEMIAILRAMIALFLICWLLGFILQIGGAGIHILLVIGVGFAIVHWIFAKRVKVKG